jgi:membrane-bound metal-dependent hydrolase YbcI (DUF457 family)
VQWLDLVWPILVLAGVEHLQVSPTEDPFLHLEFTYYPWTHSLLASIVWALLFAAAYRWRTRDTRTALWLAIGVVSHWVLDLVVHIPDLPLYPGSSVKVGFGLWRSVAGTVLVEAVIFVAAVVWYAVRTRAIDAVGRWALWALVAFLVVVYAASLLGPPPQSEAAVGASALLLWLLVPWAYWLDRHRVSSGS